MPLTSLPRKEKREQISHDVPSGTRVYEERFLGKRQATKGVILTKEQRATAWEKMYEEAAHHLQAMDANAACLFLESVGTTVLECYLVAEADGQNRVAILRQFPKPGKSARDKFHPTAEVAAAVETPKPKARKPRAKAPQKPVADVGAQSSDGDTT